MSIPSLGLKRYLSALKYVNAVVGNSSSGIIEVPSFRIPTLNIGNRQNGRIAADSVVHCGTEKQAIIEGLEKVLSSKQRDIAKKVSNPYEKENTTKRILDTIKNYPLENLVCKTFYNIK